MDDIHPYPPNFMAGSPLDRAGAKRPDAAWVADLLHDAHSVILPVWRAKNLIRDGAEAVFVPAHELRSRLDTTPWALLGLLDGAGVFALDLSADDAPVTPPGAAFQDLWQLGVGSALSPRDASLLAHARGMMHWRARHRFCSVCGAACSPTSAGHVMACQGCGIHHFPRTDPAVIMLVTRGDRALLGQAARFRHLRMFSTLAGFVEPGESLEEAVAREVLEESGVRVARVRYHSSQPWPFPSSIMLGFYADALSDEITLDDNELVDARWFTRAEILRPDGFMIPPRFSIARRLIDDWAVEYSKPGG